MSGIKDDDRLHDLRERLYERGNTPKQSQMHELSDEKHEVARSWGEAIKQKLPSTPKLPKKKPKEEAPAPKAVQSEPVRMASPSAMVAAEAARSVEIHSESTAQTPETLDMAPKRKPKKYRLRLVLAGLAFFVVAMSVSSAIIIWGNKTISGENITIAVTGPFTIGGGEVLPVQIGITNDNTVAIDSATLIVQYPLGTQAANDERNELFEERLALDSVLSGQTVNVPLRAIVFGEENEEKQIEVSIEYRVQDSNATFFKEAEPLRFKINSSPIIVRADSLKKVSSGQETVVKLEITSNSQSTLQEVLVRAEYPIGFDYTRAEPSPNSAQNVWVIKDLEPEETETIVITGVVIGKETDEYAINFLTGVPNENDPFSMASVFATAQTDFIIEQPFLDIDLVLAGSENGEVVVEAGQNVGGGVDIRNALDDTLYDIEVEVQLGGNAISDLDVGPPDGFYDSLNNKIIWDVSNAPDLRELQPGRKARLSFSIEPATDVRETPQITFDVNVKARRVSESQVAETLVGTASGAMKVESTPTLRADVGHGSGLFSDSGPVPPKAEVATTYTASFMVENTTNNISEAVVTATLPSYVKWTDQTSGAGSVSYDPVQRLVTWNAGSVDANAAAFASFQIEVLPSKTQINTTPVIVGSQQLRATDLFTGTVVRASNPAITTEMSPETGYPKDNGRVVE